MASTCYLLITHILLLLIPTVRAITLRLWVVTIDKWREERPPSPKRDGGASAARSSSRPVPGHRRRPPRPSSPPARPGPSRHHCHPPLPPARAEPRPPALSCTFRPRYSSSSPLPGIPRASLSLPPPLSPPNKDNDANDQRSVDATMDPLPEDDRPRATQSTSSSSPPPTTGGGGAEHSALCRFRDHAAALSVPLHGHPSLSSSSAGDRRVEAEVVAVAWRGGRQRRKRQRRR